MPSNVVWTQHNCDDKAQHSDEIFVDIDDDIIKFLWKRNNCFELLKKQDPNVQFHLQTGAVRVVKHTSSAIENCAESSKKLVHKFCSNFCKKRFTAPLIDSRQIQVDVSSPVAACWIAGEWLVLVAHVKIFRKKVEEIERFIQTEEKGPQNKECKSDYKAKKLPAIPVKSKSSSSQLLNDCEIATERFSSSVPQEDIQHLTPQSDPRLFQATVTASSKQLVNLPKIVRQQMLLAPGVARFMKRYMTKKIEAIQTNLKDQHVTVTLGDYGYKVNGTEQGVMSGVDGFDKLQTRIVYTSEDFSNVGLRTLISSKEFKGKLNYIEARHKVIIEKTEIRRPRETDPFDVINITIGEGLNVSWKYGNIGEERADVLVNSAVSDLTDLTEVGHSLKAVGGPAYTDECSQYKSIAIGDIVTTTGGGLACKYVVHAVCCEYMGVAWEVEFLPRLIMKILLKCHKLGVASLSMPLIGTEEHKFPTEIVLRYMRESFFQFSSLHPQSTLKEIRLIRPSPDTVSGPYPMVFIEDVLDTWKFLFYSCNKERIFAAFKDIQEFIQNHVISKTVEHGMIGEFVAEKIRELKQLASDNNVKIVCQNETSVSIEGTRNKVTEVEDKLMAMINDYNERNPSNIGTDLPMPPHWEHQPANQLVKLVVLSSSSSEYQEVLRHFVSKGGRHAQLQAVERIQNPQLYSRYMAFKNSMIGQVNEKRLFHGTNAKNIESINTMNFNRSFAGVNGVAYGQGVYFARDASYSMRYAKTTIFGSSKMYMAKVLVGDYTRGASWMKMAPSKNDPSNPSLRYDSVVDHPSDPKMYIIFQDNQYYPEYLLSVSQG